MTRHRNYVVRIAFKDFAGWKCKPVLADFLEIGGPDVMITFYMTFWAMTNQSRRKAFI